MTKVARADQSAGNKSNVLPFQTGSEAERIARQRAVREHLIALASRDGEESAIACASALLQEDGTVDIADKGIDPDIATRIADALDVLSETVRCHALKPPRRTSQRGSGTASLSIIIGFMAAAFVNQIAWIDAALILGAQLIAIRLAAQPNGR